MGNKVAVVILAKGTKIIAGKNKYVLMSDTPVQDLGNRFQDKVKAIQEKTIA